MSVYIRNMILTTSDNIETNG